MIQLYIVHGSRLRKAFNEAVASDLMPHIKITEACRDTKPKHGHLVLVAGDGQASMEVEKFAARIGAYLCYVPDAGDWLTAQIRKRIDNKVPLVMVDSALASTNQFSGAK